MFNFFRKTIDPENIKNFNDILNIVNFYIKEKKWKEAHELIDNTKEIEKENTKNRILHLDKKDPTLFEVEEKNIIKKLEKKLDKLDNLEAKLDKNESKYRFEPKAIKRYEDAIKSIKTLILLKERDEVKKIVNEIKNIEKRGLNELIKKFEEESEEILFETEKRKQLKIYNKKENELNKLLNKSINLKKKHDEKIAIEKFKIRFRKIKNEVELLSKTGKNTQALNILKAFLEENKENSSVIKFYNKEKIKILKSIELQKIKDEKKLKNNALLDAQKLIGKKIDINNEEEIIEKLSFFKKIKNKFTFYNKLKNKIKEKNLIDEVTLLISENENINREIATQKLENVHKGLIKEIYSKKVNGYDLYGKILGADKISGDSFGLNHGKDKYTLFLGDATGHGIKAGLIISLLTKFFNKYVNKTNLKELALKINNLLKQDLESRNFITGILFEIDKNKTDTVKYIGMGHEPMLVYRAKEKKVEKLIPGGLAAGIRIIKDIGHVKEKEIILENNDIILTYSDGIIEAKGRNGEFYGLDRLKKIFLKISQIENKSSNIYNHLIDDLISFRGGTSFDDDVTLMFLKRDEYFDIQEKDSKFIKTLSLKENLTTKEINKFKGKNKDDILKEVKKLKKEKNLELIILNLKKLYQVGEFLKLKQEAIRYIKEGWIHKDINMYLKKALKNETKYRIGLKNKKIENKYNIIKELYKKGDYEIVIRELEDVISKEGDI